MSTREYIIILVILVVVALAWGVVDIRGGCVEGLPCATPTRVCTCEEVGR
ncbi:MAG: hypothetical protein WC683_08140 [bacterium]